MRHTPDPTYLNPTYLIEKDQPTGPFPPRFQRYGYFSETKAVSFHNITLFPSDFLSRTDHFLAQVFRFAGRAARYGYFYKIGPSAELFGKYS